MSFFESVLRYSVSSWTAPVVAPGVPFCFDQSCAASSRELRIAEEMVQNQFNEKDKFSCRSKGYRASSKRILVIGGG